MCVDIYTDTCRDMGTDMCMDMCLDMRIYTVRDVCIDMCIGVSRHMHMPVRANTYWHAYRHVN